MKETMALAKANAKKFLRNYGIRKPGRDDVDALANIESIYVQKGKPGEALGRICYSGGEGVITISGDVSLESQKRFIIAHELGHYCNEFSGRELFYICHSEYLHNPFIKNIHEHEANEFATELLMPEEWFITLVKKKPLSKKLLDEITGCFGVGLSAIAMRYAEFGDYPAGFIFVTDGKVRWCKFNPSFPFGYVPIGTKVSNFSYAFEFFEGKEIPDEPENILADAWFLNDRNYKKDFFIKELVIPMPNYQSAMVMVWS